uniref:Exportin-6 n=1 Tax=Phallusia mammillata TaxID=59560 RepID=A0A6F9DWH0_9ASCI|nr:exportin-6 [Phallusia mammillata]
MEDEMLTGLERVMTEFFHPSTSNQRKREIEEQLTKFGNQNGAWKNCLHIFTKTRNEYVMMYCLSVLENLVNKMWVGFDPGAKSEIRQSLNHILLHRKDVPQFISNKLIKVIVDIGRVDWPMFYPNFFTGLLELAGSSNGEFGDTRTLGLIALRIASEELAAPREDVSAQRKEELKKLLLAQVPSMLKVTLDVLHAEWMHHFMQLTEVSMTTPPPSPSSGESNLFDLFSGTTQDGTLPRVTNTFEISPHSVTIITHALECLCHLFSWIPLTVNINNDLLSQIFRYARLGSCLSGHKSQNLSVLSDLGSHAMGCINELLAKNFVPHNFEDFLVRIFRQTFHLLQQLTKGDNTRECLEGLDDSYLEKFIEFLRLFVTMHFSRIDMNASFPLMPFLTLLFKFTFNQSSHEHFLNCMDIWEVLIDYIIDKAEQQKDDKKSTLTRYKEGMLQFATATLQHIQFRLNQSYLEELDNVATDENGHTEWQTYLIENLEIVAKICRLYPTEMLSILFPILEETSLVYLQANWSLIHQQPQQNHSQLHCALKDLTTALQCFGRLSELFIVEHFRDRMDKASALIEKCLRIAHYGIPLQLYQNSSLVPAQIIQDVIEVHAEALAALQPFSHWLSRLYSEAQQAGDSQAQLAQYLNGYLDVISPILTKQVPDKVVLSASHTLLSMVTTVRATFLSQSPIVEKLFRDVSNGSCNKLAMQIQCLIYKALSNLLLLPWPNTPECEQKWEVREQHHTAFIKSLFADFYALSNNAADLQHNSAVIEQAKPVINRTLVILSEIVEAIADEVLKSREICYRSLQHCIEFSLQLFPIYLTHPDITEYLMGFFLIIFRALRRQMGAQQIAAIIQSFLVTFTPEQLQSTILHENSAGVRVIEKFIKILELVIDEPGSEFKTFTPNIIVLAVEQIYPIVSQRPSPEVKGALFCLLHRLLSKRHRYFFPSPVLAALLQDGSLNTSKTGTVSHKPQFLAIMTAYGQSFLQSDITIFKQNLESLEELNKRQKLFEKLHNLFSEEGVLFQFVNVLIQTLINKSHALLQEEICGTVFNMSSADMEFFHKNFLQQFLQNTVGLTVDQKNSLYNAFKPETDLPSFTSNILRFVNDLRYFRLCNSSLPEGTVHF